MHRPQSFTRISDPKANSSNNTVFVDDEGEIAVSRASVQPRRDNRFDYSMPVDAAIHVTGLEKAARHLELPNTINPATGWGHSTERLVDSAAGLNPPVASAITPADLDMAGESYRNVSMSRDS